MYGALFGAGKLGLRALWGATKFSGSIPGLVAIGIGDQMVTGGEGRKWVGGQATEIGKDIAADVTGIDLQAFEKLKKDFEDGNWEELLSNPMLVGATALGTMALKMGVGGSGIINSAFTALIVAGAMYAAQKYALPAIFGNTASDPSTPAPVIAPPQSPSLLLEPGV